MSLHSSTAERAVSASIRRRISLRQFQRRDFWRNSQRDSTNKKLLESSFDVGVTAPPSVSTSHPRMKAPPLGWRRIQNPSCGRRDWRNPSVTPFSSSMARAVFKMPLLALRNYSGHVEVGFIHLHRFPGGRTIP